MDICIVCNHGNIYDDSKTTIKNFKKITDAYLYVCDYLTSMYESFGGDNLSLYNPDQYSNYPEYEESLSDWKNVYFLLNYGSSSGSSPHTITVSEICFD